MSPQNFLSAANSSRGTTRRVRPTAPVRFDQNRPSVIGASVSGIFLWILGILNLVVLLGIIKVFREMRTGTYDEQTLEDQLNKRGFMNRFLGGLTKSVRKPWHIYPIGVLFGLGFDTATEVGLLVLAGGAAAFNLPSTRFWSCRSCSRPACA